MRRHQKKSNVMEKGTKVMCFDEKTSWLTLTIGSIINITAFVHLWTEKQVVPAMTLIIWQYALLMQIPEGLAWRDIRTKKNISDGVQKSAFALNVLQPFVTFLVVLGVSVLTKKSLPVSFWIGAGLLAVYGIYFGVKGAQRKIDFDMKPSSQCKHLVYRWFDQITERPDAVARCLLYLVTVVLLLSGLPRLWFWTTTGIFAVSFIVSRFLYPCATASTWCWSIVLAGLITWMVGVQTKESSTV